ncbi:MAG: transposase [Rugosibacter sp.]
MGQNEIGRSFKLSHKREIKPNLRHNKRLNRFTLRGQKKVDGQWKLYCLVHNLNPQIRVQTFLDIEKLAHHAIFAKRYAPREFFILLALR